MKRIITLALAIVATVAFGNKANAQQYALHYRTVDGPVVSEGDTVDYLTTDDDKLMGLAYISFFIENLTSGNLLTDNEVVQLEGPEGLHTELCAGGNCPQQGPYTLAPGDNGQMPLTIEPTVLPQYAGQTVLYRVKVGNIGLVSNTVTVYLRVHMADNLGIESAAAPVAPAAYPNPTTGRVTVGDREYDLSGRPAGVYYLPTEKGKAKVIKL